MPELGEWIDATDLQAGQWLQTGSGTWVQINAIQRWTTQRAVVHNFTVANTHTYYVAVAGHQQRQHQGGGYADADQLELIKNYMSVIPLWPS